MRTEELINLALCDRNPVTILEDVVGGPTALLSPATPSIRRPGEGACRIEVVRSYFDSYGDLRFCSTEDVQISPHSDPRLMELIKLTYKLPTDHEILDWLDNFEGPLDEIYQRVTLSWSSDSNIRL